MRFWAFERGGCPGLAVTVANGDCRGLLDGQDEYPGTLDKVLAGGPGALKAAATALQNGELIDIGSVTLLPPLPARGKIICVGLNYLDHAAESSMKVPEYPTLFARFSSSIIGHEAPMLRPVESERLDFEGELVAVIGVRGRRIAMADALSHVAGYSVFNDGSIRDYQLRTPQWTMGKNFDGTGAFGPSFVTADELPPGARGLKVQTRLNGHVVQSASTDNLIFDVASLVSLISAGITLEPGDLIVTGTPSGVGNARTPPLFMKAGDVCEVEIEKVGLLRNRIVDDFGKARAVAA